MTHSAGGPFAARKTQLRYPPGPGTATLAYLRRRRKKRKKAGGVAPDSFTADSWSVLNTGTGGEVDVLIHAHPANNGSAINDIEYRIDGGSWVSSGGVLHFPITGLTDDVEVYIEIRAVNSTGAGTDSDDKPVTPTATFPESLVVTPRLVMLDAIMTEGGVLVFNVCRKHPYGTSSVNYTITDGTAVLSTDYDASADALSGTLNFADRELYKTISIQTLTRGGAQGSRTITCTLSSPTDAMIDDDTATGTIQDGTITVFTDADSFGDIQTAIEGGSPGDAFLFTRGDEWSGGSLTFDALAGTVANPIIIGATGAGPAPKLVNVNWWFRGNNSDAACKYVNVQDLHIKGEGLPGSRDGSFFISEGTRTFKPEHISLIRNKVENVTQAINVISAGGNQTIECCEIFNSFSIAPEGGHSQGIFFSDPDGVIRFNRMKNCGKADYQFDWHTYLSGADDTVYEYNFLSGGPDGIKVRTGDGIIVRGNEVYGTDLVGISAGTDSGSTDLTGFLAEENYVHGGQDGFYISTQAGAVTTTTATGILRNNIAVTVEPGGLRALNFAADSGNENWKILNNIFLADGKDVANISEEITGSEIRNNVFGRLDANSGLVFNIANASVQASFTGSNNLFYGNGGDILAVGGATNTPYATLAEYNVDFGGAEADSVEGDPTFVDQTNGDYTPDIGSPLIEAGYDTTSDVPNDFNGTARTDPVDIGGTETDGAPAFNTVVFDGSNDEISGISGASPNGQRMTIAMRIRLSALGRRYFHGTNGAMRWRYESDGSGSAAIHDDNGANQILSHFFGAAQWATGTWYNIVAHYDFITGESYWNVNGSDWATSGGTDTDNIDHDALTVFGNGGGERFQGDVDFLWINFGDDPVKATVLAALFESASGPHTYLGPSGVAAGVTPDLYIAGDATLWNSGAGVVGTFTMSGAVTDA